MSNVAFHYDVPHMLREIYEGPEAIRETLRQHWGGASEGIRFDRSSISSEHLADCRKVLIAASGASRHAGLFAQIVIEELAGIPVAVEHASEFCNRRVAAGENALAVFITQSGETGDTAAAQRTAHDAGYKTIAITNVIGSSIANAADAVMYTYAGMEHAIPATKTFIAQLAAVYLFALMLAAAKRRCTDGTFFRRAGELAATADLLEASLPQLNKDARIIASRLFHQNDWILLGRGVHYPVAVEGALKLKETAYVRAEGFPSGEFRHGPAATLDGSQIVLSVVAHDADDSSSMSRYRKSLELLDDIAQLTGLLVLISSAGDSNAASRTSNLITVPATPELMLPIIEATALQLLAYHVAKFRRLDVDRPRNLVKSVQAD